MANITQPKYFDKKPKKFITQRVNKYYTTVLDLCNTLHKFLNNYYTTSQCHITQLADMD